jgi:hypothetical protein
MGGAISSLDRQAVLKATEQPRFLMNAILEYIVKNIRENDVFRMQDPTVCKEFLLLSADSLDRLFKHIDVNPQTDRSGKIYFERVGRLTAPAEGTPAAAKRKLTCLAIAYFYVRILQIYLALAFTLIDDPALVPGRTPPALGAIPGNRAILPGREIGIFQRGGEIQRGGGAFTFQTLIENRVLKQSSSANVLQFEGTPDLIVERDTQRPDRYGVIYLMREVTLGQGKQKSTGAVKIHLKDPGTDSKGSAVPARILIVGIQKPEAATQQYGPYGGYGQPALIPRYRAIDPPYQLDLSNTYSSLMGSKKYDGYSKLSAVFEQLITDLEDPRIGISKLQSIVARQEKKKGEDEDEKALGGAAKAAARAPSNLKEGKGVPELQFAASLGSVASIRPLAHCITRSFQLLDVDALGSKIPPTARTHICESKFKTGSAGYEPATPTISGSITGIPGLAATNFLFFVLEQVIHLSNKTEDQLRGFLEALSLPFTGKEMQFPQKLDMGSMGTIKARNPPNCSGQVRYLNPAGIRVARGGVGRLWAYQRAHAAKVEGIFKRLFEIGKSGDKYALSINENLFKKGIPEVEKVSDAARELLMQYYGQCEEIYQETVAALDPAKFDTTRESALKAPPKK